MSGQLSPDLETSLQHRRARQRRVRTTHQGLNRGSRIRRRRTSDSRTQSRQCQQPRSCVGAVVSRGTTQDSSHPTVVSLVSSRQWTTCSAAACRRESELPFSAAGPPQQSQSGEDNREYRASRVKRSSVCAYNGESSGSVTYLKARVDGREHDCLLDTGSEVSLLPASVVPKSQIQQTDYIVRAANGTRIEVLGCAVVPITTES